MLWSKYVVVEWVKPKLEKLRLLCVIILLESSFGDFGKIIKINDKYYYIIGGGGGKAF